MAQPTPGRQGSDKKKPMFSGPPAPRPSNVGRGPFRAGNAAAPTTPPRASVRMPIQFMPKMPVAPARSADVTDRQPKEVIIRTMKDDLQEARSFEKTPQAARSAPATPPPQPADKKIFPLPPKEQSESKAAVQIPKVRRQGRLAKFVVGVALFITVFGSLGAAAWYLLWREGGVLTEDQKQTEVAALTDVIPTEALLVVRYHLLTPQSRQPIEQLWTGSPQAPTTVERLVSGDPRLLLAEGAEEILYVVLPEVGRVFLLVPEAEKVRTLLAEQRSAQVTSFKGWLIVNTIDTSPYIAALAKGTLSTATTRPSDDTLAEEGVQWIVSPNLFATLDSQDVLSGAFLPVGTNPLLLKVSSQVSSRIVSFSNDPTFGLGQDSPDRGAQLRTRIPGDATFVFMGTSFSTDLLAMVARGSTALDTTLTSQPAVEQFLTSLSEPYVYYEREGPDGLTDIGLIITLPPSLRKQLAIGDPTLETSLSILLPQIIGTTLDRKLTYSEVVYKDVPLKYVNLTQDSETLDYTVTDDYIFVASSKEGMLTLIDTIVGDSQPLQSSISWQALVDSPYASWGGEHVIAGNIQESVITQLFPTAQPTVPFVLSTTSFPAGIYLSGAIQIPAP